MPVRGPSLRDYHALGLGPAGPGCFGAL